MKEKLLLLHGALGSKKQFEKLKELLTPHFEVYDLNFAGHGGEALPDEFSMQLFAENVLTFLEQEKIGAPPVFGYSMGGYVALNVALAAPDKIGKIITLGTKFNWDEDAAAKEVRMLNPDKIEEKVPHFAEKLRQEHHPQNWKTVMKKTAGMMIGLSKGLKLTEEDFQQINHEVCVGIGSLDNMVTLEESQQVVGLLSNGRLYELENVKHPIDRVDPGIIKNYILDVL